MYVSLFFKKKKGISGLYQEIWINRCHLFCYVCFYPHTLCRHYQNENLLTFLLYISMPKIMASTCSPSVSGASDKAHASFSLGCFKPCHVNTWLKNLWHSPGEGPRPANLPPESCGLVMRQQHEEQVTLRLGHCCGMNCVRSIQRWLRLNEAVRVGPHPMVWCPSKKRTSPQWCIYYEPEPGVET